MRLSKEFEEECQRLRDEVDLKGAPAIVGSAFTVGIAMAAFLILWVIL